MSDRVRSVCIVGAGTMGAGIAQVSALSGHQTFLLDADPSRAEAAIQEIRSRISNEQAKGRISSEKAITASSSVLLLEGLSDLKSVDSFGLVIEAIAENLEAKVSVLSELERLVDSQCILASNTSSLSITEIGAKLLQPERFLGLHFFNPAPIMRLVEIVSGLATNVDTMVSARQLMESWGKTAVEVRSTPGFIVNRVARPFYAEGLRLYEEIVADPATIDAIYRECGGFRMGPFELMDLIGQDVNEAVTRTVWEANGFDPRFEPSLIQRELVEAGRLGRKSGIGFYDYRPGSSRPLPKTTDAGPCPRSVTVHGEVGGVGELLGRSGVEIVYMEGEGFIQLPCGGVFFETDGSLATSHAARLGRPVAVVDHSPDFSAVTRLAVAVSDGAPKELVDELSGLLLAAGVSTSNVDDSPGLIMGRTIAMLINGAVDLLWKRGATAEDIDTAMKLGTNYPEGPLRLGDCWGSVNVLKVLDNLASLYGDGRYRACPLLRRSALSGNSLIQPSD